MNYYALVSQTVVDFSGVRRQTPPARIGGPRWGHFVPNSLICPHLEKNPGGAHATMVSKNFRNNLLLGQKGILVKSPDK